METIFRNVYSIKQNQLFTTVILNCFNMMLMCHILKILGQFSSAFLTSPRCWADLRDKRRGEWQTDFFKRFARI